MLSKEVSSTILKVFGMTRPGIEPRSPGPLVNTLSKEEKGVQTFSKGIGLKINVIAQLEFELTYFRYSSASIGQSHMRKRI